MSPLQVALIGAGRAGLIHAANLAARLPRAALAAVADPNPTQRDEAAARFQLATAEADYRRVLDEPTIDAVVICAPTFLHCEMACAAAAAGKHVFLEKPMALTMHECQAIEQAATAAGVKLQIGFMRRFDEGFAQAKALLDSGELGKVMMIKSTGRGPGGPGPWMWDLQKSNGIVAEVNSHDIDSLLWFTGRRFTRVYAEAGNFKVPEAAEQFPDFYDNVVAMFRFDDGAIGVIDGTCPAHYGYDARVEILCEKGVIFVGSARNHGLEHITVEGEVRGQAVRSWRNLFRDAYASEMEQFVDAVREDKPTPVTGEDGMRAVEAVLAINESIRQAQPVHLALEHQP